MLKDKSIGTSMSPEVGPEVVADVGLEVGGGAGPSPVEKGSGAILVQLPRSKTATTKPVRCKLVP